MKQGVQHQQKCGGRNEPGMKRDIPGDALAGLAWLERRVQAGE